ncbi:hypothetical protein GQ54DRAFT_303193 [Martensiomyces pterosporus]|nr:hypothetical protein GQ54DRAFT_303193 [Martensiomyces pterosporus]
MAKKPKNGNGSNSGGSLRPSKDKPEEVAQNAPGSRALDTASPKPSSSVDEKDGASDKASLTEVIHKRLRNLRKKLQRAESYEAKKANGAELNPDQLLAIAKTDVYRELIKELEELGQLSADNEAEEKERQQAQLSETQHAVADAEKWGKEEALLAEVAVHHQTLRLVYAVKEKLAKVDSEQVADDDRRTLTEFYNLVLTGVVGEEAVSGSALDEKLSLPSSPESAAQHLRLLSQRDGGLVPGLESMLVAVEARYADVARIVDQVITMPAKEHNAGLEKGKDGEIVAAKDHAALTQEVQDSAGAPLADEKAGVAAAAAEGEQATTDTSQEISAKEAECGAAEKPAMAEKRLDIESGVCMPKMPSMFANTDESEPVDSDFNAQVIVPPGGLRFMASADIVDDSDDESAGEEEAEADEKASNEPVVEMVQISRVHDGPADISMPVPDNSKDLSDLEGTDTAGVGGFAHPTQQLTHTNTQPPAAPSNTGAPAEPLDESAAAAAATAGTSMPVPDVDASNAAAALGLLPGSIHHPAGFNAYGAPPGVSMHSWSAAGATPTTIPSMPGMYGVMPLPYPPHLAMQYGYIPPQMYNMAALGAGVVPSTAGASAASPHQSGAASNGSHTATPSARNSPAVPDAAGIQQQNAPASTAAVVAAAAAVISSTAPGQGEIWPATTATNSNNGESGIKGVAPSTGPETTPSGIPQQLHAPLPSGPQPVMPMPSGDPYQHAMAAAAAAAAAGYPMNVPFGYPHVDASNLSTAATGGSENNESVNSYESTSNKGGSSRPSSVHHYQQQQPTTQAQESARGFVQQQQQQPVINEYPPIVQYGWPPQPEYTKLHQQGMYNYSYQQYHSQQQSGGNGGGSGQGYRRRGSGSNSNSSGSGSSHHHQQRDRRGNSGYSQRQQRWGGGNSQNSNYRQHHNNNNNNNNHGHHHSQNQGQSQDPAATTGYGVPAANDMSAGPSSSSYYGGSYPRQQ